MHLSKIFLNEVLVYIYILERKIPDMFITLEKII